MPDIDSTPNQLETIDPEPSIIADSDNTIYIDAQSTDQCGMDEEGIQSGEKSMPSCTTRNMFAREMAALQSRQQQDVCPSHVLNKEEYMKAFEKVLLRPIYIHRLDQLNVIDTQTHSCSSRKRHKVSSSCDHSPMLPLNQSSSSFKSIGDEGDIIMSTTSTGDEDSASSYCSDEDDAESSCSDEDDAESSCSEVSMTFFIIETLF
jgi:hypothetical protein